MQVECIVLNGEKPMAAYGFYDSPVGQCLIAETDCGVCWLSFVNHSETAAFAELERYWGSSKLKLNNKRINILGNRIFTKQSSKNKSVIILVSGTPFQLKQWITLTELKPGETITYSELAQKSGFPKAIRAAGTAIGRNNVSFLIPCHRVVRSDGSIGHYRWGVEVKKKLLAWEKEWAE
jgi:AraC family transcriptional regulator of adaptative response/methylated-DNA-[protein]-cysteine methyltransferase